MTANYGKVHDLAQTILGALQEQDTTIGYGRLACALALGRLATVGDVLDDDTEIKFIEDVSEWVGMYFGAGSVQS